MVGKVISRSETLANRRPAPLGRGDRGSRFCGTPRPVRFQQPGLAGCLNSSSKAPDQGDHEQDQKDHEQDSRYSPGGGFDSSKTEERRNEGNDKENYCPVKHHSSLRPKCAKRPKCANPDDRWW